MNSVYLIAFSVINYKNNPDAAAVVVTASEDSDLDAVGLEAAALLMQTDIKQINATTPMRLDDETIRKIGLIAKQKGLID